MTLRGISKLAIVAIAIVIIVVASVAYYALVWLPSQTRPAPDNIILVHDTSITGYLGFLGKYLGYGVRWAVRVINEHGGVYVAEYGKKIPIKLIQYDDESNWDKSAANLERGVVKDGAHILISAGSPPGAVAGASVAERYHIPAITSPAPLGTVPELAKGTYKYCWNIFFNVTDPDIGMCTLQYRVMSGVSSNKKVVLFVDNTADGKVMGDYWEMYAPKYGFQIVYRGDFPVGQMDFSSMILEAKATGADILIAQCNPEDGMRIWTQCKQYGFRPKAAWFERAAEGHGWVETLGKDGDGVCVAGFWNPGLPYKVAKYNVTCKKLADDFMLETGEYWGQHLGTGATYVFVLADAIERAGSLDPEKINAAIAETDGEYLVGYVKFIPPSHECAIPLVNTQWQNGKCEITYPPEKATSTFIYPLPPWS